MVTLQTQHSVLKKIVGKDFTIAELEDMLFDLGMELDEAEGDELKIDITTERPDMVSSQGLGRAIRAFMCLKNPTYSAKKSTYEVIIDPSVSNIRPYTVCAIVKGLYLDDEKIKEIIWVQEKLHATFGRNRKKSAIGIYPLEHITLPITFKADKPKKIRFCPLESDKEMTADQILKEHPSGKAYAHLLEGLPRYPYFIDSKGQILSVPPIINSNTTGKVSITTQEIFIECSGHDLNALSQTLNILVYLFKDMGGDIYSMKLRYPDRTITTPMLEHERRTIRRSYVNQITGLDLSTKEIASHLKRMMYDVTQYDKETVSFEIAPIRTDIWHDIDIVDDIVRSYGINTIEPEVPQVATNGSVLFINKVKDQITELMIGLGFQELFTFALTDKKEQYEKMHVKEDKHIRLGYAAEQSINMVRTWLLPEAIKFCVSNRNKEFPQKMFEVSSVVRYDGQKDVLSNDIMVMCCVICSSTADFTQIKQTAVYLLDTFGFENYSFKTAQHASFIEGRSAKVIVDEKEIGIIGEVHPRVLECFELKYPLAAFELDIEALFRAYKN